MSTVFFELLGHVSRIGVALLPWAFSLYLQFRLEHDGVWVVDMPYRGLFSALLIGTGMLLSLWVYTRLKARGLD